MILALLLLASEPACMAEWIAARDAFRSSGMNSVEALDPRGASRPRTSRAAK